MRSLTLSILLLVVWCAGCAVPSEIAPRRTVARDPGGSILLRAAEIAALEAQGIEKRIAGECLSACTLYLGLSTACFEEGAVLGFHGPRLAMGLELGPAQFDALSRLMAAYYPPRVAQWFMAEARHVDAMIRVPASDLIRRGEARACAA